MELVRDMTSLDRNRSRTDTEGSTGHTVEDRANPGELRLIDGEMGTRRTLQTLLVQNGIAGLRGEAIGLDGSGPDINIAFSKLIKVTTTHLLPITLRRTALCRTVQTTTG